MLATVRACASNASITHAIHRETRVPTLASVTSACPLALLATCVATPFAGCSYAASLRTSLSVRPERSSARPTPGVGFPRARCRVGGSPPKNFPPIFLVSSAPFSAAPKNRGRIRIPGSAKGALSPPGNIRRSRYPATFPLRRPFAFPVLASASDRKFSGVEMRSPHLPRAPVPRCAASRASPSLPFGFALSLPLRAHWGK